MSNNSISPIKPVIRIYETKGRRLRDWNIKPYRKSGKNFRKTLMDKKSRICVKYR
jgi:hypothetical protein